MRIFLFVCLLSFLYACNSNPSQKEIDAIAMEIDYFPFYQDFSQLDTNRLPEELHRLQQKYPSFLNFFLDTLVGLGVHGDYEGRQEEVKQFLTFKDFRALFDTLNQRFPNTKSIDNTLTELFRSIRYQDSSFDIPSRVFYFSAALDGPAVVLQNEQNIGVGLDWFLSDFWAYDALQIPNYARVRLSPDNIPVWVAQSVYLDRYPFSPSGDSFLELMVAKGKEYLFLERVLQKTPNHLLFGYTPEQFDWAEANETAIYNTFLQQNLLYEKNPQIVMRYFIPGPNTSGFPPESPGNLGSFIGWKLLKSYEKRTKSTLRAALNEADAQKILRDANYKP